MRAAVLFVVLLLAFVLLYSNVQKYLSQQQQIAALNAQIQQARSRTDALQQELDRWQDPAYVAAQARDRLAFVMPGEVPFRVVDPETVATAPDDGASDASDATLSGPWYQVLWQSFEVAGAAVTAERAHAGDADPNAPADQNAPADPTQPSSGTENPEPDAVDPTPAPG